MYYVVLLSNAVDQWMRVGEKQLTCMCLHSSAIKLVSKEKIKQLDQVGSWC
jgi:hypothetical protein